MLDVAATVGVLHGKVDVEQVAHAGAVRERDPLEGMERPGIEGPPGSKAPLMGCAALVEANKDLFGAGLEARAAVPSEHVLPQEAGDA